METRKSDPRIYIVAFLFLSCVVSGGIFLGIYMVLPISNPLYLQAGMFLVGVPWVFWFLAYLYRCFLKPFTSEIPGEQDKKKKKDVKMKNCSPSKPQDPGLEDDPAAARTPKAEEGERRVQFGVVTVIENVDQEEEDSTNKLIGQNRSSTDLQEKTIN